MRWTRRSRDPAARSSSGSSGDCRALAVLGSPSGLGRLSLATSSDWMTTLVRLSTGSTSYSTAAMARWVRETRRVERTRMVVPAGEVHSQDRSSTPRLRSRVRSCLPSRP
ncbi:hypothetical protein STENM223S_01233 [Streptomyces tendae]